MSGSGLGMKQKSGMLFPPQQTRSQRGSAMTDTSAAPTATTRDGGGGGGGGKSDLPDSNLVYVRRVKAELKKIEKGGTNHAVRIKALNEVAHLVYLGGGSIEAFLLNTPGALDAVQTIVKSKHEVISVRVQALQTLSIVVRSIKTVQDSLCQSGMVETLYEGMSDPNEAIRQWSTHNLFLLMVKNYESYVELLLSREFQNVLRKVAKESWSQWPHNEASEFLRFLNQQ